MLVRHGSHARPGTMLRSGSGKRCATFRDASGDVEASRRSLRNTQLSRADIGCTLASPPLALRTCKRPLTSCYTPFWICNSVDRPEGYFHGKVTASRGGSNLSKCNSWQAQPRISDRARGRAAHRGRQAEPLRATLWTRRMALEDNVSRRVGRDALIRDALMDLGGWLRSLGLEQYEATFRENEDRRHGPAALHHASFTHIHSGNYGAANAEASELVSLTDEKGAAAALGRLTEYWSEVGFWPSPADRWTRSK